MTKILSIIFVMIFTKNYVLVQFLGICPFLGVSKKFDSAVGMSGAVVFVMSLAGAATCLIYTYVMVPNHLELLAATLLNVEENYTFLESCVNGFAAGVGFALALILFCGVRKALENAKPPKCFEGLPITLVAAALTSLTFMSFTGMAEKLFGG